MKVSVRLGFQNLLKILYPKTQYYPPKKVASNVQPNGKIGIPAKAAHDSARFMPLSRLPQCLTNVLRDTNETRFLEDAKTRKVNAQDFVPQRQLKWLELWDMSRVSIFDPQNCFCPLCLGPPVGFPRTHPGYRPTLRAKKKIHDVLKSFQVQRNWQVEHILKYLSTCYHQGYR